MHNSPTAIDLTAAKKHATIEELIATSWAKIAPFWPLKNLIAVNPLTGFEDLAFEEALKQGNAYFQIDNIPTPMQDINRKSIQWLQVFFDKGQATISIPGGHNGFLPSILKLLPFDYLTNNQDKKINTTQHAWLLTLPACPQAIVSECLTHLGLATADYEEFLTLQLTTLSGWAGHIQYLVNWADTQDQDQPYPVTHAEYLAFRLILTCLMWPQAKLLLSWHAQALVKTNVDSVIKKIEHLEQNYHHNLLAQLASSIQTLPAVEAKHKQVDAQLVFCIDVRSEPFRRALEAQGSYETLGFAGFFGLPISISNSTTQETYHSCPVLLKPSHQAQQTSDAEYFERQQIFKKLFQSLKYNFTTTFALVETLGPANGLWMALRSLFPNASHKLKSQVTQLINPATEAKISIDSIPFLDQCNFALGALKLMGLTTHFAPLVAFCGHGSTTQNNAYASALDCGACGGRHGSPNARILAQILNTPEVRKQLLTEGIDIPTATIFIGAEHNTTTDEVKLFDNHCDDNLNSLLNQEELTTESNYKLHHQALNQLKLDLTNACTQNTTWRCQQLGVTSPNPAKEAVHRSRDWAQVRPEWGLAQNGSFIVGPRDLSAPINLEGRAFLHSYNWQQDTDASALTTILTAPMVVAQWINSQYLFSTLDNRAYGGGNKITKNITGKIGIMQGNASDLMNGLPLQSVYATDHQEYHQPIRLMTIVYAPKARLDTIIEAQAVLKKLFSNGWVKLVCIDPQLNQRFILQRNLSWELI